MDIVTIFCEIDDFCHQFEPIFKRKSPSSQTRQRNRAMKLSLSEIMTIVVYFHISGYSNFKTYYLKQVQKTLRREFPDLVSDNRFVELMAQATVPLAVYLESRKAECRGISFVD